MSKRTWTRGGYRPGYSEAHSPMYALGREHGITDNQLEADGHEVNGPQPPNPAYPVMYMRGYNEVRNGGKS